MKSAYFIAIFMIFASARVNAASCQGRGTIIFFGNGMFNTRKDANKSRKALKNLLKNAGFEVQSKELLIKLAYKRNEPILEQLVNVAVQKGVTEFENFWAWLSSLQESPSWFKSAIQDNAVDMLKVGANRFDDLQDHFESYAKVIREGYNVVLISHSQGNMYANQAMRKFASYTDGSLTGSIEEKEKLNPLFPPFPDLFRNIQVATPASATIDDSPWTTFKDDLLIAAVRETVGALPANLQSAGIGLPPNGDLIGHNFVKAYLRVDESRQKIISDIHVAYSKLRYPIAYFQPAVVVEYTRAMNEPGVENLTFRIVGPSGEESGGYDEEWPSSDLVLQKKIADCFELKPGDSKISAETIVDHNRSYRFKYTVWPEGGADRSKEKPVVIEFQSAHGVRHWDIGVIHVKKGRGKEPLEVHAEIYSQPRPRN